MSLTSVSYREQRENADRVELLSRLSGVQDEKTLSVLQAFAKKLVRGDSRLATDEKRLEYLKKKGISCEQIGNLKQSSWLNLACAFAQGEDKLMNELKESTFAKLPAAAGCEVKFNLETAFDCVMKSYKNPRVFNTQKPYLMQSLAEANKALGKITETNSEMKTQGLKLLEELRNMQRKLDDFEVVKESRRRKQSWHSQITGMAFSLFGAVAAFVDVFAFGGGVSAFRLSLLLVPAISCLKRKVKGVGKWLKQCWDRSVAHYFKDLKRVLAIVFKHSPLKIEQIKRENVQFLEHTGRMVMGELENSFKSEITSIIDSAQALLTSEAE